MKETKELAKKETAAIAVHQAQAPAEVLRSDILVPYVVIAQGTSDSVKERRAQIGDIVRSTNAEKLADPDKPLDVVFLHYPKAQWIIETRPNTDSRWQYVRTEPRNATNETDAWTFWCDEDGNELDGQRKGAIEYRRVKQLLVFAILPHDIEASEKEMKKMEAGEMPDVSKALTPVLLSFRSNSYKAGKEVCTFYTQAQSMNLPIWKYAVAVGNSLEKNDEGSFYIWKVDRTKAKAVKKEHLPLVERWVNIVATQGASLATDEASEEQSYAQAAKPVVDQARQAEVC